MLKWLLDQSAQAMQRGKNSFPHQTGISQLDMHKQKNEITWLSHALYKH